MENKQNKDSMSRVASTSPQSKWLLWLKRISFFLVALYLLIWIFSPYAASYFVNNLLKEQYDLRLTEQTSIRYNPFTSHLAIKNFGIVPNVDNDTNSQESHNLLTLNRFNLEVRLHRFLFDEIYLSELTIDGLSLSIQQQEKALIVAGINLSESNNHSEHSQASLPATDSTEQEQPTAYTLIMPLANLSNIKAAIKRSTGEHQFDINQWQIKNVVLNNDKQALLTRLDSIVNKAPLVLTFDTELTKGKGDINIAIDLKEFELQSIQPEVREVFSQLNGQLNFSSQQKIQLDNDKLSIESEKTSLHLTNLALANEQLQVAVKSHELAVSNFAMGLQLQPDSQLLHQPISIQTIELLMKEIDAQIEENIIASQSQSVKLQGLSIEPRSLEASDDYVSKVESLVYQPESIRFENSKQLLTSEQFVVTLNDLLMEPNVNSIEQILIQGLDATFKIKPNAVAKKDDKSDGDSSAEHSNVVPPEQELAKETKSLDNTDEPQLHPAIRIGSIKVVDSEELRFIDESISPNYQQGLMIEIAELKAINSATPDQVSPFELVGNSEQYTKINFAGFIKPFTKTVNLSLKGKLSEFSLPPASSYIQDLLGFEIESGELDTNLDINIVESQIKGTTGLNIRGLALAKAENYNQDLLQEQTAMPLNMALGMLKDSDDNVDLDIPMLGNVDSPTFGIGSFVSLITKKAIQSAAKSYLISTFLPYADVISMTISAGEFILKTRFEDLIYQPGQIELAEQQQSFITQFVALMKDKPSTQVKVCGIAASSDAELNSQQNGQTTDEQKQLFNQELKTIAKQRMEQFKQAVVEQGVESSRILLCAPKLDLSKDSQPRIEFSV